jgi:hypothetical protein
MYNIGECNITKCQGGEVYPTDNIKKKANWIGHVLRRICLLKHITEGNIDGGIGSDIHNRLKVNSASEDIKCHQYWREGLKGMDISCLLSKQPRGRRYMRRPRQRWKNTFIFKGTGLEPKTLCP